MPIAYYYTTSGVNDSNNEVNWGPALWMVFGYGVSNLICYAGGRYYVSKLHSALYLQELLNDSDDDEDINDEDYYDEDNEEDQHLRDT